VEGEIKLANGERLTLDGESIIAVPERALLLLGAAMVVVAAALLAFRLQ
jgi:hypothetical protein